MLKLSSESLTEFSVNEKPSGIDDLALNSRYKRYILRLKYTVSNKTDQRREIRWAISKKVQTSEEKRHYLLSFSAL